MKDAKGHEGYLDQSRRLFREKINLEMQIAADKGINIYTCPAHHDVMPELPYAFQYSFMLEESDIYKFIFAKYGGVTECALDEAFKFMTNKMNQFIDRL